MESQSADFPKFSECPNTATKLLRPSSSSDQLKPPYLTQTVLTKKKRNRVWLARVENVRAWKPQRVYSTCAWVFQNQKRKPLAHVGAWHTRVKRTGLPGFGRVGFRGFKASEILSGGLRTWATNVWAKKRVGSDEIPDP
ncbi:hypothetical protein LINGRAPRIM_LOCUS1449 [Linum grandiflorum]